MPRRTSLNRAICCIHVLHKVHAYPDLTVESRPWTYCSFPRHMHRRPAGKERRSGQIRYGQGEARKLTAGFVHLARLRHSSPTIILVCTFGCLGH